MIHLIFSLIQVAYVDMVVPFILILVFTMLVECLYLPEVKQHVKNDTAEEIQHAICKITSKDLEATANATIFRELKGVCTSVQLQTYLKLIESKILQEIDSIKNILKQNGFKIPLEQVTKSFESIQFQPEQITEQPKFKTISFHSTSSQISPQEFNEPIVTTKSAKETILKYKYSAESSVSKSSMEEEIAQFNNTVVESNIWNIYFYYWKIQNVKDVLKKRGMYVTSPEFFLLGHGLHLQLYPNYDDDESFAIHLGASTKGFIKKHKIHILNQLDKNEDIDSDLLIGLKSEENMFEVSEDIIRESGYIWKNCMVIKLEILINS